MEKLPQMGHCALCNTEVPAEDLLAHLEAEHADELERERFRFCIYCGEDCWLEEENQHHADSCPNVTGMWPFDSTDFEHGCLCCQCNYEFREGDRYMLLDVETGQPAARPHMGEIVCQDCAFNAVALGH